jgi:hypothetical protein
MTYTPVQGNGRFVEMWAAEEHAYRVLHLVAGRGMTYRAATTVVDAAMLGIMDAILFGTGFIGSDRECRPWR